MISADCTLEQALLNLLNNAADVSPEGVELECNWSDKQLNLEIRDRGPGLSGEVARRAGQVFFTTKGSRPRSGHRPISCQCQHRTLGG